jgi:hypothetical protein
MKGANKSFNGAEKPGELSSDCFIMDREFMGHVRATYDY